MGYDDSTWQAVQLPHDYLSYGVPQYSSETVAQQHGYIPIQNGWYRKTFSVPSAWQGALIRLEFDGVYRSADLFLNGAWLSHQEEGYTGFGMWLHNASAPLNFGPNSTNILAVHIDATTFSELWSYEGAGITRDVTIVAVTNPQGVSIAPRGVYALSEIVGTVSVPAGPYGPQTADASLLPSVDVANAGAAAVTVVVNHVVVGPDGTVVANYSTSSQQLGPGAWARISATISLPAASLWFPASGPNDTPRPMYTLVTSAQLASSPSSAAGHGEVSSALTTLDSVNTTFGIRSAVFDATNGLFVNGYPVKITGLSMHGDFGGCGAAVPPNIVAFRVQKLMEMGGNAWRTAHNPPTSHLLEETDRRGVLVWLENRFLRRFPNFVQDAQDMVLRDRNHPSVIIYSLCNENGCLESPGYEGAPPGQVAGSVTAQMYKDSMVQADGTRPITGNTHALINQPGTILDALDVMGVTYDYSAYDTLHTLRPGVPVMGGESASCTSDRGFYPADNDTAGYVSSYGPVGCTGPAWSAAADRPWVSGNFAWAGQDYAGESYWPAVSSHYGVADLCYFPKPAYQWYRTYWAGARTGPGGQPVGDPSVVYAYPSWEGLAVGSSTTIIAYTAAPLAELVVNGVSQGNVTIPAFGYAQWNNVVYAPGGYIVRAYDNMTGAVLGSYTSVTPGPPVALNLTLDWPGSGAGGALTLDNMDTAIVTVTAIDTNGLVVGTAGHNVTFTLSGKGTVYGVCNGDPADHSPQKASSRKLYVGLARLIVQAGVPGSGESDVTVMVSAPGLQPAALIIPTMDPTAL